MQGSPNTTHSVSSQTAALEKPTNSEYLDNLSDMEHGFAARESILLFLAAVALCP